MADQIRPVVRMLLPCESAICVFDDEAEEWKYLITAPWSTVMLPPNASFPFRPVRLSLYAQMMQGVGKFQIHAEMRRVGVDGDGRVSLLKKS